MRVSDVMNIKVAVISADAPCEEIVAKMGMHPRANP